MVNFNKFGNSAHQTAIASNPIWTRINTPTDPRQGPNYLRWQKMRESPIMKKASQLQDPKQGEKYKEFIELQNNIKKSQATTSKDPKQGKNYKKFRRLQSRLIQDKRQAESRAFVKKVFNKKDTLPTIPENNNLM